MSYSHMGAPTLPSALTRFTSEFGMGSGGTTLPLPPSKFVFNVRKAFVLIFINLHMFIQSCVATYKTTLVLYG